MCDPDFYDEDDILPRVVHHTADVVFDGLDAGWLEGSPLPAISAATSQVTRISE